MKGLERDRDRELIFGSQQSYFTLAHNIVLCQNEFPKILSIISVTSLVLPSYGPFALALQLLRLSLSSDKVSSTFLNTFSSTPT